MANSRKDDISVKLAKAVKEGFLPNVSDAEVEILEVEARALRYGDIHPGPEDLAVGDSSMPRSYIVTSACATTSGWLRLTYFTATKTETVNNVRYTLGSVQSGATPTLCRLGLYIENDDLSLTLVASTANDTALFAGGTFAAYTKALTAPYKKIRGRRYAIALIIVTAAATPTVYGNFAVTNSIAGQEPKLGAAISGQADLPAEIPNANLIGSGSLYYLEVYP